MKLSANFETNVWNFFDKENNLVRAALSPCMFGKSGFQNAIPSKRESFNIGELFIHHHPHNHPHNHKACRLAINSSQLACSRNLPMNDKCTMQILYSTNILHCTLIYEYLFMLYMPYA